MQVPAFVIVTGNVLGVPVPVGTFPKSTSPGLASSSPVQSPKFITPPDVGPVEGFVVVLLVPAAATSTWVVPVASRGRRRAAPVLAVPLAGTGGCASADRLGYVLSVS